jgi:hypothetical protein
MMAARAFLETYDEDDEVVVVAAAAAHFVRKHFL